MQKRVEQKSEVPVKGEVISFDLRVPRKNYSIRLGFPTYLVYIYNWRRAARESLDKRGLIRSQGSARCFDRAFSLSPPLDGFGLVFGS